MDLSQEERWQAADYIFSQGKRLESLSYKLLDLFVLQQQELTFAPVSSSELTDAIVPMMKQNLAAKDVMLSMHLAPATLYGDKDLLLSLLINPDRQRQKGFLVWRYDHCAWLFRAMTITASAYRIPAREFPQMKSTKSPNLFIW